MKTMKMTRHKASTRFMFDTRRLLKNGKYPVRIEVYYRGQTMRYGTGISLSPKEWKEIDSINSTSPLLKNERKRLMKFITSANEIIHELDQDFSFPVFTYRFCGRMIKGFINMYDVYDVMQDYANNLKKDGRMGSFDSYTYTLNSLRMFKTQLTFEEITVDFLKRYESYMLNKNKSYATIGIHLRNLRAMVNIALMHKIITKESYPFGAGRGKYLIPQACAVKKALSDEDLAKILKYKPISSTEEWALDIWLFSFYCNGMNTADIFDLTHENISGDILHFYRQKTKTSKQRQEPVEVFITDPIKEILLKRRNKDLKEGHYIFDIYEPGMNLEEKHYARKHAIRKIDKILRRIKERANIDAKFNISVARHTWTTLLVRNNASLVYISRGLGHTSLKTTQEYIGNFNDDEKEEYGLLIQNIKENLITQGL